MALSFDTLFKAFKENVTATVMTLLVLAMSALFTINQVTNKGIIKDQKALTTNCETQKYVVQMQMERLNDKYIETFGLLREVQSEIKILKKLGKIE